MKKVQYILKRVGFWSITIPLIPVFILGLSLKMVVDSFTGGWRKAYYFRRWLVE